MSWEWLETGKPVGFISVGRNKRNLIANGMDTSDRMGLFPVGQLVVLEMPSIWGELIGAKRWIHQS